MAQPTRGICSAKVQGSSSIPAAGLQLIIPLVHCAIAVRQSCRVMRLQCIVNRTRVTTYPPNSLIVQRQGRREADWRPTHVMRCLPIISVVHVRTTIPRWSGAPRRTAVIAICRFFGHKCSAQCTQGSRFEGEHCYRLRLLTDRHRLIKHYASYVHESGADRCPSMLNEMEARTHVHHRPSGAAAEVSAQWRPQRMLAASRCVVR